MSVHFGSGSSTPQQYGLSGMDKTFYRLAKSFSEIPDRIDRKVEQLSTSGNGAGGRIRNGIVRQIGNFFKTVFDYDYRQFFQLNFKDKIRFLISEPPIGALMFLLFPATIIPRLLRAQERGKKNNDNREFADILRRDLLTITTFLFMLNPLLNLLNKIKQKTSGLQLVDEKTNKTLNYFQFRNYEITGPHILEALLKSNSGKGLEKALVETVDRTLLTLPDGEKLLSLTMQDVKSGKVQNDFTKKLIELKQGIRELVAAHARGGDIKAESQRVFKLVEKCNIAVNKVIEDLQNNNASKDLIKQAMKHKDAFKDAVVNRAKRGRLPQDLLGLALVVLAIGWFPTWFNGLWNRKKFEEEQAVQQAKNAANFTPAVAARTYQALKASPFSLAARRAGQL